MRSLRGPGRDAHARRQLGGGIIHPAIVIIAAVGDPQGKLPDCDSQQDDEKKYPEAKWLQQTRSLFEPCALPQGACAFPLKPLILPKICGGVKNCAGTTLLARLEGD